MSRLKANCTHHLADGDTTFQLNGRDAWALTELVLAGERGCTSIDNPGPRWSGYVLKLRKAGLAIETIREGHKGPFPGFHARYVLRSSVTLSGDAVMEWTGQLEILGGAPRQKRIEAA